MIISIFENPILGPIGAVLLIGFIIYVVISFFKKKKY